ncbi:MAG: hypothetical protein GTO21_01355 [Armatimonadetes bacterium]|nr:hypothetical protein [Armatimonadota bacterium]
MQTKTAREDEDAFIEKIAREIARRRLEVPAVMFLEIHRPISFLGSQAIFFCAPFLKFIVPPDGAEKFARLLDTPGGVDRLIQSIEEAANRHET